MARRFIRPRLVDQSGNVLEGGWLRILEAGDVTEVDVYAAQVGGSPLTQPLTTDARGEVECWLDAGTSVDLEWSDSGSVTIAATGRRATFSTFTEFVDADPVAAAGLHSALPDLATSGHPAAVISGLGSAALQPSSAFDAAGTAAAVLSTSAQKAANLSDLANAGTARTNLGLGGAATLAVGTTAGTVAAGDDSRLVAVPADMLGVFSGGGDFVGVPGQGFVTAATGTLTAGRDYYFPFEVRRSLTVTFAQIQVTTGPASDATIYVGIYAATNAGQPSGSPLLNTTISCTSGATGIKSVSGLSAALPAGNYVSVINTTVNFVIRVYGSAVGTGFSANLGTGPGNGYVWGTRAAAAFTSSPTVWDNTSFNGGLSMAVNALFFKWTTP